VIAEVEGSVQMFGFEWIRTNFGGSASLVAHNHSLDIVQYIWQLGINSDLYRQKQ
jgi:hypothetical protein